MDATASGHIAAGIRYRNRIRWVLLPNSGELKEILEKFFLNQKIREIPRWTAVATHPLNRGIFALTRWGQDRAGGIWYQPPTFLEPQVLPEIFRFLERVDQDISRGAKRRQIAYASALELAKLILKMENFEETLMHIAAQATLLLQAERCSLFLVNESRSAMDTYMCVRRVGSQEVERDPWVNISVPRGRGIVWRAIEENMPLVVDNVREHPDFYAEADLQTGYVTRNLLAIPLFYEPGSAVGVMEVLNKIRGSFTREDMEMATIFAAMAAPIVRLAQMYQELRTSQAQLEMANRLLEAQLQANEAELKKLQVQLELQKKRSTRVSRYHRLVGQSPAMKKVYELIDHVSHTDLPVLIIGESGTGKELVARSIHEASPRANARFIAVNCAAIPETLMERELFGAERGAFTGAVQTHKGLFEAADGGTLFLDEISEMPLSMQAKLLRVIEDREVRRLGSTKSIKVDVRIIAATNKDLKEYVEAGKFREDLFYRLNVFRIDLPPLRERKEDIPILIDHFLRQLVDELNLPEVYVDPEVIRLMMVYEWPGNVRQLENEIRRMAALGRGRITPEYLSIEILNQARPSPGTPGVTHRWGLVFHRDDDFHIERVEAELIRLVLERTRWNKAKAARLLGVSRRTLYDKMAKYGIVRNPSSDVTRTH